MPPTFRRIGSLLKETFDDWIADRVPQLGAALAFYTALSLAPLLVLSLRVAALIFDESTVRGEIESQIESLVGKDGAEAVRAMLESANAPGHGAWATLLSAATLLLGASGVFGQLQTSLNTIWEVEPRPGRGIRGFLRDRLLSMSIVLGVAFLLLVSLILSALLSFASAQITWPDDQAWLAHLASIALSLVVFTLLFAVMFKVVPDVEMRWRDVWWGATVTTVLFAIGKFAIGLYLARSEMASSYGVAGSFVVLLVWVFYSAQVVFFGAELTQAYANQYGSGIRPSAHAQSMARQS
jgi:membrane protein